MNKIFIYVPTIAWEYMHTKFFVVVAFYLNFNITEHPISLLASLVSKSSSWDILRVGHV